MSHATSVTTQVSAPTQAETAVSLAPEMPNFLKTAGVVSKLFFAGLAGLGGVACFCVGITFTPFSPEAGIAAFAIGTSLFGLAGVILFNSLTPSNNQPVSREFTPHVI